MLRFGCPSCKTVIQANEQQAGATLACPKCKGHMKVPGVAAQARPAPAPQPRAAVAAPPTRPVVAPAKPMAPQAPAPKMAPRPAPAPSRPAPAAVQPLPETLAFPSPANGPSGTVTASSKTPIWKNALHEGREITIATWAQTLRLIRFGTGKGRGVSLQRAIGKAHFALGKRMNEVGIGSPQIRQEIATLDEKIVQTKAVKGKTKPMDAERSKCLLRLAEPALGMAKAPNGVEKEHALVRKLQADLAQQKNAQTVARSGLLPHGRRDWLRVSAGYGVAAGVLFFAFLLFGPGGTATSNGGGSTDSPTNSKSPTQLAKLNELDFVPRDAVGFIHVRFADMLANDLLKDVREKMSTDWVDQMKQFETNEGVPSSELMTITEFFLKPRQSEAITSHPPLEIVRTKAPYEKDKVIKAYLQEAEEASYQGKSFHVSRDIRKKAILFLDDRLYLIGNRNDIESYLEIKNPKETEGPLAEALKKAENNHHFVGSWSYDNFENDLGGQVPAQFEVVRPLLKMQAGNVVLDLGKETTLDLEMVFPDEKIAKDAARAWKNISPLIQLPLGQFKQSLQANPNQADLVKLVEFVADALSDMVAEAKGVTLQVKLRLKTDDEFLKLIHSVIEKAKQGAGLLRSFDDSVRIVIHRSRDDAPGPMQPTARSKFMHHAATCGSTSSNLCVLPQVWLHYKRP